MTQVQLPLFGEEQPPDLPPLADAADRARMGTDVGRRLVAVAGAGSGKTTQLVERVQTTLAGVQGVAAVPASQLAVITFTDKAARELVHRLRAGPAGAAIEDAYVGTIHGFCAAILRSFPIEAGLPPKFSVADEITSRSDAEARARRVVATVYDRSADDPDLRDALTAVAAQVGLHALASIVAVIDHRWDEFQAIALEPPPTAALHDLRARLLDGADAFVAQAKPGKTLNAFAAKIDALRTAPLTLAATSRLAPPRLGRLGGAALAAEREAIADAHDALVGHACTAVLYRLVEAFRPLVLAMAARRIADGQLGYDDLLVLTRQLLQRNDTVRTELRRRHQRVFVDEFQDTDRVQYEIIRLLTDPGPDDRPDTPRLFAVGDPKQSIYAFRQAEVELFNELAGEAERDGALAHLTANFRTRTNVATWINTVMARRFALPLTPKSKREELEDLGMWPPPMPVPYEPLAPERPAAAPGETAPGPAVVLLGVDVDGETEPADDASSPDSADDASSPDGAAADGAAASTPVARKHPTAELAQRAEADDIAALVQRITDERWGVLVEQPVPGGGRTWSSRPADRRDIAVLVARRTGLGELEETLRRAGIAYRIEGGTLAYDRREVYELLRVLRAIANPADELLLVTALRTSILGCSDADLFAYRHRQLGVRGTWRTRDEPELPAAPHPGDDGEEAGVRRVRRALARIHGWARDAHRRGPAVLISDVYDWSMGAAAARFEGEHMVSETWRRVRYLIDEARAWSDETSGTLQEYLAWVADKVEAVERSEIAPDETDEDAVRILTIHAAKGLEFPIVIVAGLGTKDNFMADRFRAVVSDGGVEVKLGALATPGFPGRDDISAWAEEARLVYVAMTRARDHLVVSCHTSERSTPNPAQRIAGHFDLEHAERWTAGERPPSAAAPADLDVLRAMVAEQPVTDDELAARPAPDRRAIWTPSALAAREHDLAEGAPAEQAEADGDEFGRPRDAIDVTPRDPGLQRDPGSGLEALRSRGRYGTDVGKAVHEVMQRLDLDDPARGFDALVTAACDNVDLADGEIRERVRQLARSIVGSGLFERMRAAPVCEREIYVGAVGEVDGEPATIWGYADAVFETGDGSYAVVDFKTDSSASTDDELRERYTAQLRAYADVIEQATGRRVGECWLLVGRIDEPAKEIPIVRP